MNSLLCQICFSFVKQDVGENEKELFLLLSFLASPRGIRWFSVEGKNLLVHYAN